MPLSTAAALDQCCMFADSFQMENFSIYSPLNSSTSVLWMSPFLVEGVPSYALLLPCFIEADANNENP